MNYGEILEKSWKTIWKHKVLWIFGLLASCSRGGGGGGGGQGINYQFSNRDFRSGAPFGNLPPGLERFLNELGQWFNSEAAWIILALFVLFFLVLWLVLFVLGIFGRIGLVRGAWLADEGIEQLPFGELWRGSLPYFWQVVLLMLLFFATTLAVVLVLIGPAILISVLTLGIGIFCLLIPLICLLVPLFWALSVWLEQAIVAVVGENLGVIEGIKRGWEVIRNNLAQMLVMSLILLIGAAVIGFLIGLPILLVMVPLILSLFALDQGVFWYGLGFSAVLFLLYLPLAIALNAVLQAYLGTAWTLTFRRLTGRGPATAGESEAGETAPA